MSRIAPIVVAALVRDGRILFIRREGFPFTGLLSLPGGKIEFGETMEEAAIREVSEETGIRSRFVRHLSTIPEHITEGGRMLTHFMIQLCELEYIEESPDREFDPVWIDISNLESIKERITPSDYFMIKKILLPGRVQSFHSLIEKSGDSYIQKEFREI